MRQPIRRFAALIPLRGGSKSIPRKNIRPIAGRPLFEWTADAALKASAIDDVYVSTDCDEIELFARNFSPLIKIIRRPPELGSDTASTEGVMLHALQMIECTDLVTIQATSPMLIDTDLNMAIDYYCDNDFDSLVTTVRSKRFYWSDSGQPINYDPASRPRRQEFRGTLMENGAFYISSRQILESQACRLGGRIGVFEMSALSGTEIDEPEDWAIVESLLIEHRTRQNSKTLQDIRLLICDVDGTLTDGGMYYSTDGEFLKKFSTRDGMGLELVRKLGVEVVIMTSENSGIVTKRMDKLKIPNVHLGVTDKRSQLLKLAKSKNLQMSQIAYIGDDLNDLPCAELVGFFACPSDAVESVVRAANFVSRYAGGHGAVREVCDVICASKT